MKLGGLAAENHKLINLMQFNWHATLSIRHNDVITAKISGFYKILLIETEKFINVFDYKKTTNKCFKSIKIIFAFNIRDATYQMFGLASHVISEKFQNSILALAHQM